MLKRLSKCHGKRCYRVKLQWATSGSLVDLEFPSDRMTIDFSWLNNNTTTIEHRSHTVYLHANASVGLTCDEITDPSDAKQSDPWLVKCSCSPCITSIKKYVVKYKICKKNKNTKIFQKNLPFTPDAHFSYISISTTYYVLSTEVMLEALIGVAWNSVKKRVADRNVYDQIRFQFPPLGALSYLSIHLFIRY